MLLRSKAISIVAVTSAVLLVALAATFHHVLDGEFTRLEQADLDDRVALVEESLGQLTAAVDRQALDWSVRDDLQRFLETPDPAWFEAHVGPAWMKPSGIGICVLSD